MTQLQHLIDAVFEFLTSWMLGKYLICSSFTHHWSCLLLTTVMLITVHSNWWPSVSFRITESFGFLKEYGNYQIVFMLLILVGFMPSYAGNSLTTVHHYFLALYW